MGTPLWVRVHRPLADEAVLRLVRDGVSEVVLPVAWRSVEPRAGQWEGRGLDHLLEGVRRHGLPFSLALGPMRPDRLPRWVDERGGVDAADFPERFAAFAALVAAHVADTRAIRVEEAHHAVPWEAMFWRTRRGEASRSAAGPLRWIAAALRAIGESRPGLPRLVVIDAGLPGWRDGLGGLRGAGVEADRLVVCKHHFGLLPDPRLAASWGGVMASARALCPWPVDAELAAPTHRERFSPARQAEWVRIAAAAALDAGAVRLGWAALRDQAHDDPQLGYWVPDRQRHLGLWYYDGTPKPAWDEWLAAARERRFEA